MREPVHDGSIVVQDPRDALIERLQPENAHLLRDFQEIKEGPPEAACIGAALVRLGQQVLHHWHRYKAGAMVPCAVILRRREPAETSFETRTISGSSSGPGASILPTTIQPRISDALASPLHDHEVAG